MLCSHCRERYYPQIAPCIIVAIRRDDSILLAQHTRHRNGVHTCLLYTSSLTSQTLRSLGQWFQIATGGG